METLKFNRRLHASGQSGFSMIEMLIAIIVLSVGLLSLAGFMSRTEMTTGQSRYVNTAALLCSEKLEELSGLSPNSNEIRIVSGHAAGGLTSDESTTINGDIISYYDQVTISAANGSIRETKVDADGKYMTIMQKPNGIAKQEILTSPPADDGGTITFQRHWLIENNVSGLPAQVRRITVLVEYPSGAGKATYQMSMVRNAEQ